MSDTNQEFQFDYVAFLSGLLGIDDPDDYEYRQCYLYEEHSHNDTPSVVALRREGWKIHMTYACTEDGTFYYAMRRPLNQPPQPED